MDKRDAKKEIEEMPNTSFKNKHGEKFTIYSNGYTVLMGGDEVDSMVSEEHAPYGFINLFNEHFNIWSAEELLLLGEALKVVALANIEQSASRKDINDSVNSYSKKG